MKKWISLALVLMMVFGLAAFAMADDGKVGELGAGIYSDTDDFNTYIASAIIKNAEGRVNIKNVDSGSNNQATQNDQVDAWIAKGADAIALSVVDTAAAEGLMNKCIQAGNLPIIFFNKVITDQDLINSYDNVYQITSTAGYYGADIEAEIMVNAWNSGAIDKNGDGIMQVALLRGDPNHTATEPRAMGVYDTLTANGVQYEVLADDYGDWDTATAKEKMDSWISKFGDEIEFIVCANDAMALGSLQSIQAAGFNENGSASEKYIPIIGIDALPSVLPLIETGEMYASVLQDSSTQGWLVDQVAYNMINGLDVMNGIDLVAMGIEYDEANKTFGVPYTPIDKDNLASAEAAYQ